MMSPPANQRLAGETHHRREMEQKQLRRSSCAEGWFLCTRTKNNKHFISCGPAKEWDADVDCWFTAARSGFKEKIPLHCCTLPSSRTRRDTENKSIRVQASGSRYICSTDRTMSVPLLNRGPVETQPHMMCRGLLRAVEGRI